MADVMTPEEIVIFARRLTYKMHRKGHIPGCVELEDLVQATVLAALRAQKRYRGENGASLKTYMAHRIIGTVKDEVERLMRTQADVSLDDDKGDYHTPFHLETPERYAIELDTAESVKMAAARLPERLRKVFDMRYHQDLMHVHIAKAMGVSETRISQLHTDMVEHLRRQLVR